LAAPVAAAARSRAVIFRVDAPQHRQPLEFPAPLLDELRDALAVYVARRRETELAVVRRTLTQLCRLAHRQGLGPERVVIAVKTAWVAVPETQPQKTWDRSDPLRKLWERVLTACLDLYFAERERGEPPAPRTP